MDFAQEQRNPTKHLLGIGFVVLLHIGIGYALMNGLAVKVVAFIQEPLKTKIIEDVTPPPPPDTPPPPPPDFKAPPPPPSFVPPPETATQTPPPPNAIVAATQVVPVERTIAPAPAPTSTAPAPAAPPAPPSVRGLCSNVKEVGDAMQDKFVVLAGKEEITHAEATVEVVIGPSGEIKSARVVKSSNPKVNSLAVGAVKRLSCRGQGADVTTYYPVEFNLKEE